MVVMVHRWDANGICSASLIANMFGSGWIEWKNYAPPLGEFELDNGVRKGIDDSEEVFFADLNISIEDVEKQVVFMNHHIQEKIRKENVQHINLIIEGGSSEEFPSATRVTSTHFSLWDHLSALGALGDMEVLW